MKSGFWATCSHQDQERLSNGNSSSRWNLPSAFAATGTIYWSTAIKGGFRLKNRVAFSFLGWPNLSGCSLVRQSLMKSNIGLCISSLTSIISGSAAPIICRSIILVKSFIRRLPRQRLMKCLKIPKQTLLFMHTFIIRSCVIRLQNNLSSTPENTYVFEDSFHGLQAGMTSGATVIGLATTNTRKAITGKAHYIIDDFAEMTYEKLLTMQR